MQLFIEDLAGKTDEEVREHIVTEYEVCRATVDLYDIIIAYESVGNWGCDSASFFLIKGKSTGILYEVNGSHCSCYGFEGQFDPEETTAEYLKSSKFSFHNGGYDGDPKGNKEKLLDYIRTQL